MYYQFVYKKLSMIQHTSLVLTDKETIQLIICGLDNRAQELAKTCSAKTPAQLANYLKKLEKPNNQSNVHPTYRTQCQFPTPVKSQPGDNQNMTVSCDYFGFIGHTRQICCKYKKHCEVGELRNCTICGTLGHLQRACQQKDNNQQLLRHEPN